MSSRPVHLVQLLPDARLGGAERIALKLMRAVAVACPDWKQSFVVMERREDQVSPSLEGMGFRVTPLGVTRRVDPRVVWRLPHVLDPHDNTIIHAHMPRAALLGQTARYGWSRRRTRLLYTEHSLLHAVHAVTRCVHRLGATFADRVIAVSEAVAESLRHEAAFPYRLEGRLEVILNGVDVEGTAVAASGWEHVRQELAIPSQSRVLVVPANIRYPKGHDVLFRALALMARRDVIVLLAGREDAIAGEWRGLAEKLGISGCLRWLGFRTDLPRLLRAADVVVMPSRFEGLPMALLEAIALGGLPVVTDVGGMGALVRDIGRRAVPPEEPGALGAALGAALGLSLEERRRLGKIGTAVIQERFSERAMLARYVKCYRDLEHGLVGAQAS